MWANPKSPNLPDYTLFVQNVMGIDIAYLPSNSPFLDYALTSALDIVQWVPTVSSRDYTFAVYNCAGHIQLKITPDQVVDGVQRQFFLGKRQEFRLLQQVNGTVNSSSDESTSVSNAVSWALTELTIQDLDFMRTPWGRWYLEYAQSYGPGIWGLS